MEQTENKQLLRNKNVLDEISRHQWLESEKAGEDIGFEKAAEEWLTNFSSDWMNYHLPKQTGSSKSRSEKKGKSSSASSAKTSRTQKKSKTK